MMQIKPVNCISPTIQRPDFDITKLTQKVARSSNMSERHVEKRETLPIDDHSKGSMMKDPSRNHPAYTRRASQVIQNQLNRIRGKSRDMSKRKESIGASWNGKDLIDDTSIYAPGVHKQSTLTDLVGIGQNVHDRRCKKTAEPQRFRRTILPAEKSPLYTAMLSKNTVNGSILHKFKTKKPSIDTSPLAMLERIEAIKCHVDDMPTTVASNMTTSQIRKRSVFEPERAASTRFFEAKRFSHIMSLQSDAE